MIKNNNISSLDLFRGIAGYGVAICHYFYYIYNQSDFQFYSIFFVEFFFILSGFVLFPQIKKVYNNLSNVKVFYIRRWLRTIPPYIVALICYSLIFTKFDSDTLKYLFFIQLISEDFVKEDYFSVAWSLSVEEFFYLIFPIFLLIFNNKKLIHIIILFIFLIYIIKLFHLYIGVDEEFYRVGTFLRLDSIAFGAIARIYYKKIESNLYNIVSSILILVLINYFFSNIKNLSNFDLFIFIILIQVFSINMIVFFINANSLIKNKFLINLFSLLAKQTYSIYLFHLIFIHIFSKNIQILESQFTFIIYLFSLFVFSSFFYYFFERIIIKNRPVYSN